jgi:hypothetical protein
MTESLGGPRCRWPSRRLRSRLATASCAKSLRNHQPQPRDRRGAAGDVTIGLHACPSIRRIQIYNSPISDDAATDAGNGISKLFRINGLLEVIRDSRT